MVAYKQETEAKPKELILNFGEELRRKSELE
jgi:hypothetical protein